MLTGYSKSMDAKRREREAKRASAWRCSVLNYHPLGIAPAWARAIISTLNFSGFEELIAAAEADTEWEGVPYDPAGVQTGELYVDERGRRVMPVGRLQHASGVEVVFCEVDLHGQPVDSRYSEQLEIDFLAEFILTEAIVGLAQSKLTVRAA